MHHTHNSHNTAEATSNSNQWQEFFAHVHVVSLSEHVASSLEHQNPKWLMHTPPKPTFKNREGWCRWALYPRKYQVRAGGLEHLDYFSIIFHHIRNVMIPTDELICFRGVGSTTNRCECRFKSELPWLRSWVILRNTEYAWPFQETRWEFLVFCLFNSYYRGW